MAQISEHFLIQEFVPKITYDTLGHDECVKLIDPRLISLAEFYREFFDCPIIINNWHSGGTFTLRGWRPKDCPVGAPKSKHKEGQAFDCNSSKYSTKQMYDAILSNQKDFMDAGLTTIENIAFAKTWIHSDIRPSNLNRILIVNP